MRLTLSGDQLKLFPQSLCFNINLICEHEMASQDWFSFSHDGGITAAFFCPSLYQLPSLSVLVSIIEKD